METLEIDWPTTGSRQTFHHLAASQWIEVTEGEPDLRVVSLKRLTFAGGPSGEP